ncbi:MAG: hypothetical protein WC742_13830 [Gallionellaceae bacterium]
MIAYKAYAYPANFSPYAHLYSQFSYAVFPHDLRGDEFLETLSADFFYSASSAVDNARFARVSWTESALQIQPINVEFAQSNGHVSKYEFKPMRSQSTLQTFVLYASINGKIASKDQDTSLSRGLNELNAANAYPNDETFADQGYLLNLETRMQLPKISEMVAGDVQLIGFIDTGSVTINKNTWADGLNRRTLSGTGFGFNWTEETNFEVKAYFANKLNTKSASEAPDASWRFWLQGVKYF